MRNHPIALVLLGSLVAVGPFSAADVTEAVFCASHQERRPIRPDLDENDRTRDENFDIDGVLDSLGIRPGMRVGDVGAGWGYMSFKLARRVAPGGTVLAEDINPAFLDLLRSRAAERGLTNVETLLGTTTDPRLPAGGLDMVFMHAVVQFIADRPSFIRTVAASLKDGGRLVIIEPESSGPAPDDGIYGPGRLPTRSGYLEVFRRAALLLVSSEVRRTRGANPIGSSEYTVFVLERARTQAAKAEPPKGAATFDIEDSVRGPLAVLEARAKDRGVRNIQTVLGTQADPALPPRTLDMVVMTATFKLLKDPVLLFNNITPSLRPGGIDATTLPYHTIFTLSQR